MQVFFRVRKVLLVSAYSICPSVTISRLPYEALNYNKLVHHPPIFEPIFRQNRSEPSEENEKNSKEEYPRKYRELLEENTQKINTPQENQLLRGPELNFLCKNRRKICHVSRTLFSYITQRIKVFTF